MQAYVNHPRYGDKPIQSTYAFSKGEIDHAHWRYNYVKYFPETAIPAEVEKQQFTDIYPRLLYVDIEETCECCGKKFIFYALEQKHWFEELEFWIDSHCTRCINCRKQDQSIRYMQKSYQKLVMNKQRTEQETKELKKIALELFQLGYIVDRNKIDNIC